MIEPLTQFQERRVRANQAVASKEMREEQERAIDDIPENEYFPILFWCNTHRRQATHIHRKTYGRTVEIRHVCDPRLGGIMIPCQCVDLTGIAEITKTDSDLPPAAKVESERRPLSESPTGFPQVTTTTVFEADGTLSSQHSTYGVPPPEQP